MSLPLEEAYVGDAGQSLSWPRLGLMAAGASVAAAAMGVVVDLLVSLFGLLGNLNYSATVLSGYGFWVGLVLFIVLMIIIAVVVLAIAATKDYDPSLDYNPR
jgi:hypothetical protein